MNPAEPLAYRMRPRTLEEYVKGSGWIKQKDFKTTFQRGTKITPLFKATVWYGK